MNGGWWNLLGLAKRAQVLVAGDSWVEETLRTGKGKLLILAGDAGERQAAHYRRRAAEMGVEVLTQGDKTALGRAIGLSPRAVLLVTDHGFAEKIKAGITGQ